MRPHVKICCIGSDDEAALAVRYGAYAVGLVSAMPSGPGPIPDQLARDIAATVPPSVHSFLLTSRQDVDLIVEQQKYVGSSAIQIVDRLTSGSYMDLRERLPGISIVQVIHIEDDHSVDEAVAAAQYVDMLLLDSGSPNVEPKLLGGTACTHDWARSKRIVDAVRKPVFLAGGLNADNVLSAVERVNPFGVDVCSGVRTNGKLDERKLSAFFDCIDTLE